MSHQSNNLNIVCGELEIGSSSERVEMLNSIQQIVRLKGGQAYQRKMSIRMFAVEIRINGGNTS